MNFDLRPYICKQCGGQIDPATMRCKHCDTYYDDPALKRIEITTKVPGEHTIRANVRVDYDEMCDYPEAARDYALRELRNQLADALLAYMKIDIFDDFSIEFNKRTQLIRGEVRVVDPSFSPSFGRY